MHTAQNDNTLKIDNNQKDDECITSSSIKKNIDYKKSENQMEGDQPDFTLKNKNKIKTDENVLKDMCEFPSTSGTVHLKLISHLLRYIQSF